MGVDWLTISDVLLNGHWKRNCFFFFCCWRKSISNQLHSMTMHSILDDGKLLSCHLKIGFGFFLYPKWKMFTYNSLFEIIIHFHRCNNADGCCYMSVAHFIFLPSIALFKWKFVAMGSIITHFTYVHCIPMIVDIDSIYFTDIDSHWQWSGPVIDTEYDPCTLCIYATWCGLFLVECNKMEIVINWIITGAASFDFCFFLAHFSFSPKTKLLRWNIEIDSLKLPSRLP